MRLDLHGTVSPRDGDGRAWLADTEDWLRDHYSQMLFGVLTGASEEGWPTLYLRFHPADAGVALSIAPEGEAGWGQASVSTRPMVRLVADTSGPGPGYHRFLVALARRLGAERHVRWRAERCDDATGFFRTGDTRAVEQAFDQALSEAARALQGPLRAGASDLALGLPPGTRYLSRGEVHTPLGPRGESWLGAVAADGAAGRDIYPWWEDGRGVAYALGRALTLMWLEVRWRPPLHDAEHATLVEICALLEGLLTRDPLPDLPWHPWAEILQHLGDRGPLAQRILVEAARVTEPGLTTGYRRRRVRERLPGGWSIEVPGHLAEELQDDGTWCGYNEGFTVLVSVMAADAEARGAAPLLGVADDGPLAVLEDQGEGWTGRATLEEVTETVSDPERYSPPQELRYLRLAGRATAADSLVVCTICFEDPGDQPLAEQIWRSLRCEG